MSKSIEWVNQVWKVADLKFWEHNPRTMTDQQDQLLEESIVEGGVFQIPVVNKDGMIIAGHQRVRKLMEMGVSTVECRTATRQLTDAEYRELNIRDNKNTGAFDIDRLRTEGGFQDEALVAEFGFSEAQLEAAPFQEPVDPNEGMKVDPVAEAKVAFDNAEQKQIVIVVPTEDYDELVDKLAELIAHFQVEKPAEVVAALIREKYEGLHTNV